MEIIVGLSGGVDSAVAAYELLQAGHKVTGVYMQNWDEQDESGVCTSDQDYRDVRAVARILGIPYYTVNFTEEYRQRVFDIFLKAYRAGHTPNPDILCNREIKFKAFLDYALKSGADGIATGHYAQLRRCGERVELLRGADANKDQSYFLAALREDQLRRAYFPIGHMQKSEVRAIAAQLNLPVAKKKDSTGICFIGERNFKRFLMQYFDVQPGDIRLTTGEIVGRHDGLMFYTLGQRRGLGIGGRPGMPDRYFVVAKDMDANALIVSCGGDSALLYSEALTAQEVTFIAGKAPDTSFACGAKCRYRQPDQQALVEMTGENICRVKFREPQRAVTPGQWVVFYQGDMCLGGGIISEA